VLVFWLRENFDPDCTAVRAVLHRRSVLQREPEVEADDGFEISAQNSRSQVAAETCSECTDPETKGAFHIDPQVARTKAMAGELKEMATAKAA